MKLFNKKQADENINEILESEQPTTNKVSEELTDNVPVSAEPVIEGYDDEGNPIYKETESELDIVGYDDNGDPIYGPHREIVGYDNNADPIYADQISRFPTWLIPTIVVVLTAVLSFVLAVGYYDWGSKAKVEVVVSEVRDTAEDYRIVKDKSGKIEKVIDPDGNTIADVKNGDKIEVNKASGDIIITHKDGVIVTISSDGTKTTKNPDGTVEIVTPDGEVIDKDSKGNVISTSSASNTSSTASNAQTGTSKPNSTGVYNLKFNSDYSVTTDMPTTIGTFGLGTEEHIGTIMGKNTVYIFDTCTVNVSGSTPNGRILIDADGKDVTLNLNGVNLTSTFSTPIQVYAAKNVYLNVNGNNTITDAAADISWETYKYSKFNADDQSYTPNSVIYSQCDLKIKGSGTLNVVSSCQSQKNGITTRDDLLVQTATVNVKTPLGHGVNGRDSATVTGGATLNITAGKDGLRATNENDTANGYITVEQSSIVIDAGYDGIQAGSTLTIGNGNLNIKTHGADSGDTMNTTSSKGLKGEAVVINGGNITIDSKDSAIYANTIRTPSVVGITINGGTVKCDSSGTGLNSRDGNLTINGGNVTVSSKNECAKTNHNFIINGGIFFGTCNTEEQPLPTSVKQHAICFNLPGASTVAHDTNVSMSISGTAIANLLINRKTGYIIYSAPGIPTGELTVTTSGDGKSYSGSVGQLITYLAPVE